MFYANSVDDLLVHSKECRLMIRPNVDYTYMCLACSYHVHGSTRMRRHLRKHTGEKPYKCVYYSFECVHCSEQIEFHFDLMMQHTLLCSSNHESNGSYVCIGCSFCTNFARLMEKHLVQLLAKKTCAESGYGHIEVIEKKQLNNPKLKQVCLAPVTSDYTTVLLFPKEIKSECSSDKNMFVCSLCQYLTRFRSNLKRHMRTMHEASIHQGGTMVIAGKKLKPILPKRNPPLVRNKEGLFVCSRCNYRTRFSNNFRRHVNQHHDGDRTFVCSECEFQTHSAYLLNSHMKNKHKDKEYATGIDVEELEDVIVIRK
ncbi:hypothetical protein WDU94_006315 [Cyamophila willieti]